MSDHDCTPETLTWVRSGKLGNPEALRDVLDILRQGRDFLQIVDPIAQGLATVAEVEAWIVTIFQAVSTPRALGLVLSELLLAWVKEYLTDGAYIIQHGNLRELFNRTGVMTFVEGAERYLDADTTRRLAGRTGEASQWIQIGEDAKEDAGAFDAYTQIPQLIQAQLDLRQRQSVRSIVDAFSDTQFNSFDEWLSPLLAAFYDPGDPFKPVAFPQDRLGGFILAVQGTNPVEVYEAWMRLKTLIFDIAENDLDLSGVWEDAYENLGLDTMSQWEFTDSLGWNGVSTRMRKHLIPRYSSTPDFLRVSTADALPVLGDLLLDLTNLAEFAGLPFPENFSLLTMAQKLADKIRRYLSVLDAAIDALSATADILDLADVWRLAIPLDTGGVDGLVERIQSAERDDVVRLTWGTLLRGNDADGAPTLEEFAYGRVGDVPDDTSGVPAYVDAGSPVRGTWLPEATLVQLAADFDALGRTFSYADAKVWRAGDTMRRSRAENLRKAFPAVGYEQPGNLLIYGVGIFLVEGALFRLLSSLLSPDSDDWREYLCDGPVTRPSQDAFVTDSDVATGSGSSGELPTEGSAYGSGSGPEPPAATPEPQVDASAPEASGSDSDAQMGAPPRRALNLVERYGSARTVDIQGRCIGQATHEQILHTYLRGARLVALGHGTAPLGGSAQWQTSRMTPIPWSGSPPHAPVPPIEGASSHDRVGVEAWQVGDPAALGGGFPIAASELDDVVLDPGGSSAVSATLSAALTAAGYPGSVATHNWCLDVELRLEGTARGFYRAHLVGHDAPNDRVFLYPALPMGALLSQAAPERAHWFCADSVELDLLPAIPSPEDLDPLEDCPGVTFDLPAAFLKRASSRSGDLDQPCVTSLMAVSGGHACGADARSWGGWQALTLAPGSSAREAVVSAWGGDEGTRSVNIDPPEAWPPREVLATGAVEADGTLTLLPALEAGRWAEALTAEETLDVRVHEPAPDAVWGAAPQRAPLHDHWRFLTACAPRFARIGLGSSEDADAYVLARPSTWAHLLVLPSGSSQWVKVELTSLDGGGAPLDSATSGRPGAPSWRCPVGSSARALYAGGSWVLVIEVTPVTGSDDEGTYGRMRPWARWVPFGRHDPDADDALEPGDVLLTGCGPHGRAGIGARFLGAYAGCDPAQQGTSWRQVLPGTSGMYLRPASEARGGAIAVQGVMAWSSWFAARGSYVWLEGASHRVLATLSEVGATIHLDERDLSTGVWVRRASTGALTWQGEDRLAIVAQVLPYTRELTLLVSVDRTDTWVPLADVSVTVDAEDPYPLPRTLHGLREAGGTWRVGATPRARSVLDDSTLLPWTEYGGVLHSTPPMGIESVTYTEVSIDAPDALLDLYR